MWGEEPMGTARLRCRRIFLPVWVLALVFAILAISPAWGLDDDEYNGYSADTLTVKVGYYGGPYYEKKVFTLDELWGMNVVNADYTFVDNLPSVIIDHVSGVRLSDLMDAAGIDLNSIRTFYFWTRDKNSDYYTSYSKADLIDTPRYCFYSLPDNFDSETGTANEYAGENKEYVDTVIALADDWNRVQAGATFGSDYMNLNTNTRFRLIFGQTDPNEQTAERSAKWIHEIVVELGGAPTITLKDANLEGEVGSVLRTEANVQAESTVLANEKVTWSSSDESVAVVDENGNITIKSEGSAVITASFGGVSASVNVNGSGSSEPEPEPPDGTNDDPNGGSGGGMGGGNDPDGNSGGTGGGVSEQPTENQQGTDNRTDGKTQSVSGEAVEIGTAATGEGEAGGVQNWRVYEMSETATELPEIDGDNPLLPVTGAAAAGLFGLSGVGYAATFYHNLGNAGRMRNVYKRKFN